MTTLKVIFCNDPSGMSKDQTIFIEMQSGLSLYHCVDGNSLTNKVLKALEERGFDPYGHIISIETV